MTQQNLDIVREKMLKSWNYQVIFWWKWQISINLRAKRLSSRINVFLNMGESTPNVESAFVIIIIAFFIKRKLYSKGADSVLSHNTIQNVVCLGEAFLVLSTIRPDTARVLAETEATFPLSPSWKMMRPISSMQGDTVPCRLTDFRAVCLCYVPPSLILEAVGGRF